MKKIFSAAAAFALLISCCGCNAQPQDSEIVFSNLGDITLSETEKPITVTDDEGKTVTDEEGAAVTSIPEKTTPPEESTKGTTKNNQPAVTDVPKSSQGTATTVASPAQTAPKAETQPVKITTPAVTSASNTVTQPAPKNSTVITLGSSVKIEGSGAGADGGHVLISAGGTYCLTGTLTSGQIEVNTPEKVHLYFNGMNVKNANGPALLVTDAKRITVTLMEGTVNYIEDGGRDIENNGALFTNDTLEIKGEGALYVKGNNREGIASDDDIIIQSGSLYIRSVDDGLNANDDISINGGYVYIIAGGDGIDSKGTTNINGGTVIIAGTGAAESAVESDDVFTMTGGTLIGAGGSGTLKTPVVSSAQYTVLFKYQSVKAAGTLLRLLGGGQSVATFAPVSDYSSLTISSPLLKSGMECTLYSGGSCSGTQINGLYSGGTYTGGEDLGSFAISSKVSGFNVK